MISNLLSSKKIVAVISSYVTSIFSWNPDTEDYWTRQGFGRVGGYNVVVYDNSIFISCTIYPCIKRFRF